MQTLQNPVSVTYEIKQSKFIAHLVPYHAFETYLERLKSEHPKARHFVTAFRYLNDFEQIVEGSSGDGEPKGTSGKPSLDGHGGDGDPGGVFCEGGAACGARGGSAIGAAGFRQDRTGFEKNPYLLPTLSTVFLTV